jgi:phospholipase/carboxylesterase
MKQVIHGLPTNLVELEGDPSAPLVVAMHGIGSNEDDLPSAYSWLKDRAPMAFPRSPLPHPPGYAWYRLIRFGVPDPASFEQALSELDAWLEELRRLPGMAERPLILSGFSQGAIMSLSYALRHPEKVAGVMAFSGYIPQPVLDAVPAPAAGSPKPSTFITLGRRDGIFDFSRLEETAQELVARGIQPVVFAHDGAHEIPREAISAAKAWYDRTFKA